MSILYYRDEIIATLISIYFRDETTSSLMPIGPIYTGDGSSVEKDHPCSINRERNIRRTFGVSCDSYRVYVPVNSKTAHPPRANPGAFDVFEKFWSNSPLCCQFRRSNAPPVRASKRVKSPNLQGKQNRLPLEINRIAYLWKQVPQNFQPLRISCSACLRSTL